MGIHSNRFIPRCQCRQRFSADSVFFRQIRTRRTTSIAERDALFLVELPIKFSLCQLKLVTSKIMKSNHLIILVFMNWLQSSGATKSSYNNWDCGVRLSSETQGKKTKSKIRIIINVSKSRIDRAIH